jgi:hypothetical protein
VTAWLKVIGTTSGPLRDDWGNHAPSILRLASFGKKPGQGSFVPGDEFVYYALRGDLSRVVAVGKVIGDVYYRDRDPGWPWLVPVGLEARRELISEGIPLERLQVDRNLRKSVQRRSHLRLTAREFERARQAFDLV